MKAVRAPKPIVMEPMSAAGRSRAACVKCGLCSNPSPFVEGYVPDGYTGEYLFIIDYPHMEFARTGNPYEGMTGELLRAAMQDAGLRRKQVAVMPALRCQPLLTGSKKPKITSLRACAPFLYRALHQLQAPRVLVLGEAAAKSLLNSSKPARIVKLRGRVQTLETEGNTYQWWVTYSIHDALKNPQTYTRIVEDIDRFEWPLTPHPGNTPPKSTKAVGFDSEFWEDEVFCGAVSDGKTSVVYPVSDWKKKLPPLLDGRVFIGHQPAVDLEALLKKGVRLKSMELWLQGKKQRDTILEAKLADENRGKDGYRLENLLLSDYRTDSWKVDTEAYGINSSLWPPDLRNERCRLDAWATVLAHEAALDRIEGPSQMCHAIAMTLRRIFHTGVYLDEKTVKRMHRVVAQNKEEARKEVMAWVTERFGWDEFDPGKDAHVRELLYDRDKLGLPIKARTKAGLPSADAKRLKEASEAVPELAQVLRYNKYDKLDSTYCASLAEKFQRQPGGRLWMPVRINPLAAKTGRRASDSPNLQNWPVSVRRIIVSRFKDGVIADNDYCVSPSARVLCADLRWRAAQDLAVGQEIIAFPEHGSKRKMQRAHVTSLKTLTRPTMRVVTDRGSVEVSCEHRWLVKASGKHAYDWKMTQDIVPGEYIPFYAEPWEEDRTREGGYLAGLYDGEGWVSGGSVGFGQNEGPILRDVEDALQRRGFSTTVYGQGKTKSLQIEGPVGEKLRLLGMLRPKRLLSKASVLWEGRQGWGKHSTPAKVLAVQHVRKDGPVVAIGTTTNTVIVEGLFSHNSKLEPVLGGWVTGEHRLSEYFTKHENGYIKIGEDFFKTTVDKKSDQYRAIKALVLAIIYNQKKWSLAENLWIVHGVRLDSSYERHQELAGEMLDKFLTDLFPGIIEYQERQEAFVLEHGYVTNALGQKRRLPLPPEPPRSEKEAYRKWCKYRAHVVNQAINGPIQGLASYVTGAGMIDLERRFLEEYKLSYEEYHVRLMEKRWPTMPLLCIEVHDDLVLDIPGKLAEKTTPVVHEVMSEVPSLRAILSDLNVTLKIETNIGPCWGLKG